MPSEDRKETSITGKNEAFLVGKNFKLAFCPKTLADYPL